MILTDEEIKELTGLTKSMAQSAVIIDISSQDLMGEYRLIEAAVLEKLRRQKPAAWRFYQSGFQHFTDEKRDWYDAVNIEEVTPLYAAPMPDDSLQLYKNLADEYGLSVFEDIAGLKKQRDKLLAAIEQTLDENGHLADGENCTLIVLKKALAKAKGGT